MLILGNLNRIMIMKQISGAVEGVSPSFHDSDLYAMILPPRVNRAGGKP
jgi:hypothetical protein